VISPAQVAQLQKSQFDTMFALSHSVMQAAEQWVELNLTAARSMLEESATQVRNLAGAKDARVFLEAGERLARPASEKLSEYGQTLQMIGTAVYDDFDRIIQTQVNENTARLSEMIDLAASNAPTSAAPAFAAWRDSIAMAQTTYDSVRASTQQALKLAETIPSPRSNQQRQNRKAV
jgi:phasin family protein